MKNCRDISLKLLVVLAAGPSVLLAAPFEMPKTAVSMETCLQAALSKYDGSVVKLEFKEEHQQPVYEFEIQHKPNESYELECDANTGKITEEEREVDSPEDPKFKAKAKISLDQARKVALDKVPGEIVETEYEIESSGEPSFEFDIRTAGGKEAKLEVSAASGAIVEDDEREIYQIGWE